MRHEQQTRVLVTLFLLLVSTFAEAQQPKEVPRIGYLTNASLSAGAANIKSFQQGLRDQVPTR
jgi:hypothetical protein